MVIGDQVGFKNPREGLHGTILQKTGRTHRQGPVHQLQQFLQSLFQVIGEVCIQKLLSDLFIFGLLMDGLHQVVPLHKNIKLIRADDGRTGRPDIHFRDNFRKVQIVN